MVLAATRVQVVRLERIGNGRLIDSRAGCLPMGHGTSDVGQELLVRLAGGQSSEDMARMADLCFIKPPCGGCWALGEFPAVSGLGLVPADNPVAVLAGRAKVEKC